MTRSTLTASVDGRGLSNARLIAELQSVALGIHLVGLDRLPEVMHPVVQDQTLQSQPYKGD